MECCSKADFGLISRRGQYAKSEGVLLQDKLSGNSQDSHHRQDERHEMRRFGADWSHTSLRQGSGLGEFTSNLPQTIDLYTHCRVETHGILVDPAKSCRPTLDI